MLDLYPYYIRHVVLVWTTYAIFAAVFCFLLG